MIELDISYIGRRYFVDRGFGFYDVCYLKSINQDVAILLYNTNLTGGSLTSNIKDLYESKQGFMDTTSQNPYAKRELLVERGNEFKRTFFNAVHLKSWQAKSLIKYE